MRLEKHLHKFNNHLEYNGYRKVDWSEKDNIFKTLVNKLFEVSENMESDASELNINSLERLDNKSDIVQCGLRIIKQHGLEQNYYEE